MPATFELAVELSRPGGRIANIGVHRAPATLHLEDQWTRDITITTGLVDAYSTRTLLRLLASHHITPGGSSRTVSRWMSSTRLTTCSPGQPTPAH